MNIEKGHFTRTKADNKTPNDHATPWMTGSPELSGIISSRIHTDEGNVMMDTPVYNETVGSAKFFRSKK